jgi:acyl-[acyl carrier protein]--UDP-N-acetylglucosamine O-acyltransferase
MDKIEPKVQSLNQCLFVPGTTLQGVSIGPFCTVGPSARVGDACQLHAGSHVVGDTELGEGCVVQT